MGDCEGEVGEKFLLQKRDMEVPSCTVWALNSAMNRFQPNTWVEVRKEGVDAKVKALSMYRGVMRLYPHPRSAEAIEGLAAYRGGQAGCN